MSVPQAGQAVWGTEEAEMNAILCLTSPGQLRKTIEKYEELTGGTTMEEAIRSECSGALQEGYLAIGQFCLSDCLGTSPWVSSLSVCLGYLAMGQFSLCLPWLPRHGSVLSLFALATSPWVSSLSVCLGYLAMGQFSLSLSLSLFAWATSP